MWFIREFLLKNCYEVYVLEISVTEQHSRFFTDNKVHVISCPKKILEWYRGGKPGSCFKTIYMYYGLMRTIVASGKYDLINLHYVEWFEVILCLLLKKIQKSKLILSYWGSDLFRTPQKLLSRTRRLLKNADYITFDNEDMKEKFEEIYPESRKLIHEVVFLGLPILEIIEEKEKKQSKESIRKKWHIPQDKKVIAIGYNAIPEQQHIEVIKSIACLDVGVRDNLFLLFQMTYGRDEVYCSQVKEYADTTGCPCLFLESFLTDDQVAELRLITDVYINAQLTDAFSGSVCENLFAGSVLVNAKWLRYKEFDTSEFRFIEFSDWTDLVEKIRVALKNDENLSVNKELVWNMRSWEKCAPKWNDVYTKVLEKK